MIPVARLFAAETYDLKENLKPGSVQQVQAVLEVRGDLLVEAGDGDRQKLPIVVNGKASYDERLLSGSGRKRTASLGAQLS